MARTGLYLMAMAEGAGNPKLMIGLGNDCILAVTHPQSASILEQFRALQSVEARNAFGDALMLLARLMADGAEVRL